MTLTNACDHPWLTLCAAAEEDRERARVSDTPGPAASPVDPGTSGPNCKTRSTGPDHDQCPRGRPSSVGIQLDASVAPAQDGDVGVEPPPRGTKRKVAHRTFATPVRTRCVVEDVDDADVSSPLDNKQPEDGRGGEKARPTKRARTIRQKVPSDASDEEPGLRPVRRSRRLNPGMGPAP
ncbi:hypothetical protein BD413DRAFT_586166 [Trametes elegans]|nr:hypothetical protein BD413DRAFT_586166 [Trametes elegans]